MSLLPSPTSRPGGPRSRVSARPAPSAGTGETALARRWRAAVSALAQRPELVEATAALHQASAELRWNEALRRRWREARAEASVREAVAGAALEGAPALAQELREEIARGVRGRADQAVTGDPALDVAGAVWRAGCRVVETMDPLAGRRRAAFQPAPALLAALHRDLLSGLVGAGALPLAQVGRPRPADQVPREGTPAAPPLGEELTLRWQTLLWLIDVGGLPALVRVGLVHAEMACTAPMAAGNAALGRLLVRYLSVREGLEPTGVSVPSYALAQDPAGYRQALAGYASGELDGVLAWLVWQARALLVGIEQGRQVCRTVQAGTTAVAR